MRRLPSWMAAALAGVLVVTGIVVFAVAGAQQPAVVVYDGSYPPLTEVESPYDSTLSIAYEDGFLLAWTTGEALGAGLVVAGLLVLAALAGWLLGRRAGARGGT